MSNTNDEYTGDGLVGELVPYHPNIVVFNTGLGMGGHVAYNPAWNHPDPSKRESLLELYVRTLTTILKLGWRVHSATFAAEVAHIYVDTNVEDWEGMVVGPSEAQRVGETD